MHVLKTSYHIDILRCSLYIPRKYSPPPTPLFALFFFTAQLDQILNVWHERERERERERRRERGRGRERGGERESGREREREIKKSESESER